MSDDLLLPFTSDGEPIVATETDEPTDEPVTNADATEEPSEQGVPDAEPAEPQVDVHREKLEEEPAQEPETEAPTPEPQAPAAAAGGALDSETLSALREANRERLDAGGFTDAQADLAFELAHSLARDALAPILEGLGRASEAASNADVDAARERVVQRIPELNAQWDRVDAASSKLDIGNFATIDEVLETAAQLAGLTVYSTPTEAKKAARELSRAKRNGTPTVISRRQTERPLTQESANDIALDLILRGKTSDAQKIMAQFRAGRR